MIQDSVVSVREVGEALTDLGSGLKELGQNEWRIDLRNGRSVPAWIAIRDGWLVLEAPLSENRATTDPWSLLRDTHSPADESRLVIDAKTGKALARGEVPLGRKNDWQGRIGSVSQAIARTCSQRSHPDGMADVRSGTTAPRATSTSGERRLGELLDASRWDWAARDDHVLSVALMESGGARCRLSPRTDGGVLARAELHGGPSGTPNVHYAVGRFLLTSVGTFRLVHAFARVDEGRDRVGLGVVFHSAVTAEEMNHGLSALSLAVARLRAPVLALTDPTVAGRYLEVRGWSPTDPGERSDGSGGPPMGRTGNRRASGIRRKQKTRTLAASNANQGGS